MPAGKPAPPPPPPPPRPKSVGLLFGLEAPPAPPPPPPYPHLIIPLGLLLIWHANSTPNALVPSPPSGAGEAPVPLPPLPPAPNILPLSPISNCNSVPAGHRPVLKATFPAGPGSEPTDLLTCTITFLPPCHCALGELKTCEELTLPLGLVR